MADIKYTVRMFLTNAINGVVTDDDKAMAQTMLDALDKRNEKRRNTPNKTQIANADTKTQIYSYLADNGARVASEIGTAFDISTQKASALCKQLVDEGKVTVADIKIKGKGTVKQYKVAE